jgi:2-dehydropantoate 2-reductase
MKIAIIGTGGVGGYFGVRLAMAGHDVRFLARGEHLKAIRQGGIFLKSIHGDAHLKEAFATDKFEAIGKADLILLTVKSFQVKVLAPRLQLLLQDNTIILPLQNGIMAAKELLFHLPSRHIINGLCKIFSMVESPGVINHKGVDPMIVYGELNNEQTERIKQLQILFSDAGIKNKLADNIEAEVWKKFIGICVSGLLAVSKTTYGELRSHEPHRKMMLDLLTEGYELAGKLGVRIEPDYLEKAIAFIDSFAHSATASLTRDVWAGRRSEVEYQNGTIVRLAEEIGMEVPVNKYVYESITALESNL